MSQYTIEALLGAGAFGKVYRARLSNDEGFQKTVAIKVLHADRVDEEEVQRLRDEARLLGLLHHRAIVQVHDLFEMEDGWAVVMELVGGCDLSAVVQRAPLPAPVALGIIAEVAAALDAAVSTVHDGVPLNLVHRDIKPANMRLTPAGEVKVLDFGIARADFHTREARTQTDQVLGTLRYMAPERFEGHSPPASDIYAVGIVLAQLLGARLGKMGLMGVERHDQRVQNALEPVREIYSPAVAALTREMLDADPTRRPTAADVALRCRRLLASSEGPSLQEWAAQHVPNLTAQADSRPVDDRVGARVSSGSVQRLQTGTQSATMSWVATLGLLGSTGMLVGALGVLVLAVALVAWALVGRDGPEPVAWELALERVSPPAREISWVTPLTDGRVAFARAERCWLTQADGSRPVQLSPAVGTCARPAPAPDGTSVAYWLDGAMYQWTPDGIGLIREQAVPLAFSPDGSQLAYVATDAADPDGKVSAAWLRVRTADGTDRRVLDDEDITGAIWSRDGRSLLAYSTTARRWVHVPLNGGPPTHIEQSAVPWVFTADGASVVAVGGSADKPELTQLDLGPNGLPIGDARVLSALSGKAQVGASADGTALRVMVSDTSWAHDLWTFDGDVVASQTALRVPPRYQDVFPTPTGYALVGEQANPGRPRSARESHHRIALWDGLGEAVPLYSFDGEIHSIGPTLDGSAVYWHQREPAALMAITLAPGAQPSTLVDLAAVPVRDLRLSQDGRRIALLSEDQRLVFGAVDQDLAALLDNPPATAPTGWSPRDWIPGTQELLATNAERRLARIDTLTGAVTEIANDVIYATALDADRIAIYHEAGTDLLIDGRRLRVLNQAASFHPVGDGARFVVRQELHTQDLYRADLTRP